LSFSIIIGATVLASSLFILADVGPKLMDISVFGLFGFLLASILGIGLIIGILRSGKL
jgi:ubiquinone biosynthesis protein